MNMKLLFTGNVQGVGFRYRAQDFAVELGLLGTVRNTADGKVELYIQGSPDTIQQLITKLKTHFAHRIEHIDTQEIVPPLTYPDFRIIR